MDEEGIRGVPSWRARSVSRARQNGHALVARIRDEGENRISKRASEIRWRGALRTLSKRRSNSDAIQRKAHRPAMKHLNAIVAYHMIEMAKAILHGETEAGSVQRMVMPQLENIKMIEIRNDQLIATTPATMKDIEKALRREENKRIELMREADLMARMNELQAQRLEKQRLQKLEREIPTNAA